MANMLRYKARWTGFSGAPGNSVFHMRDFDTDVPTGPQAVAGAARLRTFFDGLKAYFPNGVTIQIQSDVEVVESTNGQMTGILSAGTVQPVSGTALSSTNYAAAVGGVVTWRTGGVVRGRRVRGRTFLVPMSSVAFQNDGTLSAQCLSDMNAQATTLRDSTGSPDIGIWSRPSGPAATDGEWFAVTGHTVPDMGAVLRSRRD